MSWPASRAHQELTPEHVLAALLDQQDGITGALLRKLGVDPAHGPAVGRRARWTRSRRSAASSADIYVGRRLKDLIEEATKQSKEFKDEYVSSEHLLLALAGQGLRRRQPGAEGRRRRARTRS